MLPHVDYLTVHTPLTPENENLISHETIQLLKPGVRLINAARGGIYNEAALVEGLKSGKIAGVALDVFHEEPCTNSPLFGLPGVICTPHLGASTEEAQTQVAVEAVQLLVNYLTTGEIRHAVNAAAIDPKTLASLRGFLDVCYRLGQLAAQLHRGPAKTCRLSYRGDVAAKNIQLLSAAFCAGLLVRAMDEEVNIVNAEMLMRERGIELASQASTEHGAFSSSIKAELVTQQRTHTVSGTLFGNDMPRLIRVDDFRLEAYLDGILMFFHHDDVPGIIGSVGTIFGTHRVNIAQMSVGRAGEKPGGPAIGVLNLDGEPPQAALDEVLAHPHIQTATVVKLPKAGELPPWLVG
jgi:D-3-phosphoglycerate dehydrogenase